MLLLSLPSGVGIMLLIRRSTHIVLTSGQCDVSSNDGWDIVVMSCCSIIVITYAVGIARAMTSPEVVYHKALRRTLAYLMCFLLSYGAKAAQDLILPGWNVISHVSWLLLCLNGFMHTVCYFMQNRRLIRPQNDAKRELRDQLSFHVDFSTSATRGRRRESQETEHGADSYFDFDNDTGHEESLAISSTDSSNTDIVSTAEGSRV